MAATFYTYIHRKKDTGEVFYVGKGTGQRYRTKQYRSTYWHRTVDKHGLLAEVVEEYDNEADAFAMERYLIASYRQLGVNLCNLTDGGDGAAGAKRTEEWKRRAGQWVSKALTGRKDSEETRRRKSEAAKGRPMSPEAIAKTAAFHTGRKRSPETLAKMSAALKGKGLGRKKSEQEKEANRIRMTGRQFSEETKRKMSEARLGKQFGPQTEEHKAKIAAARKRYWDEVKAGIRPAPKPRNRPSEIRL